MKLEELELFEFFKDEHGLLYDGLGIGSVGIITPNQMINAVNIDGHLRMEFYLVGVVMLIYSHGLRLLNKFIR